MRNPSIVFFVMLVLLGFLFSGGCKSKQASEERDQAQEVEQTNASSVTAMPEGSLSIFDDSPEMPGKVQATAPWATKEQPAKHISKEKDSEDITTIETGGGAVSPNAKTQIMPARKPIKIKGIKPKETLEEQEGEGESN